MTHNPTDIVTLMNDSRQPSDMDVLAALLQTNTTDSRSAAVRALGQYGSLSALVNVPVQELQQTLELTEMQTKVLAAALEFACRLNRYDGCERPVVNTAAEAACLLADMRYLQQEQVRLILLDSHNRVLAIPTLYIGTLHGTVIRPAEVFRAALVRNCPAFILGHNHPQGDPAPSPEDVALTRSLIAAGKLLDIQLLDHLIIAGQGWQSLKQQGLAF